MSVDKKSKNKTSVSRRKFIEYAGVATAAFGTSLLVQNNFAPNSNVNIRKSIPDPSSADQKTYLQNADTIYDRHWQQTIENVSALKAKYSTPAFGKIPTMSCFEQLGRCIDPTDKALFGTSQLLHTLQTLEGMETDGITDPDMLIAAATHDLGKILLLTDEAPENIVCANRPIGSYESNVGLDNVVFQWNHDEFAYDKLKQYMPDHVSWLIRYHSIDFKKSAPLMDHRDKEYFERYLKTFRKYDSGTKSISHIPAKRLDDYAELIHHYLPRELVI